MNTREAASFRLERTFAASPEEVFEAWTNPAVLERWWGARPRWSSPGCEVDLRVGGRYRLQMRDGESDQIRAIGGEYREVVRPSRLLYTWCWEGEDGPYAGEVSLVSVEFRAEGAGTTVVLEHSGLGSEESRSAHGAGWRGSLESLAQTIFNQGGQS
jgi:uncharacterized protein YndB with AHSA1/START domain